MGEGKTVLVTGATGQQGGSIGKRLTAKGYQVLGLTRNPEAPAAKNLENLGMEMIQGNFDDAPGLEAACKKVEVLYLMGTPFEAGPETETAQGVAAIDAAKAAGIKHLVYSSVGSADKKTEIPHFDSKYRVEQHLESADIPYTILGPVWFMENATSPWYLPELKQGRLPMPMPSDRAVQQIAVDNIGGVAVAVIEGGSRYFGKRIDLAGDELSCARMTEILAEASGKDITYVEVDLDAMREQNEDWARMFEWFDRVGYDVDIEGLKQEFPEAGWVTFKEWARAQDWKALLG